ncbi:MAG: family N-acetyltransferase [Clostridia bacterium]|nr:family N-acetyltransferase [Clostridia bacterium]
MNEIKIDFYKNDDLNKCIDLLINAYNCEPWNNHWTADTAKRYLQEFVSCPRFVGFTISLDKNIVGAAFCHERTWWNNDELYVDEFYIDPNYQRQGFGKQLIQFIENYIKEKKLAGFTLLTNKYMPAPNFYRKNGFADAEHVLFMYKEI